MAVKKPTAATPAAAPVSEKKQAIAAAMDQITRMYGISGGGSARGARLD